jgi:hypothetical protein
VPFTGANQKTDHLSSPGDEASIKRISNCKFLNRGTFLIDFTFPQRLHEETNTDDFRSDLSEIIGETVFQDADRQWPNPNWFEPSSDAAEFFLSSPREFYSSCARVLDAEGATLLSKWRLDKP